MNVNECSTKYLPHCLPEWMSMNAVQSIYHIACLNECQWMQYKVSTTLPAWMNVNECSTKYLPHCLPKWMLMNAVQSIYHIACLVNVNECSTKYLPHCLPEWMLMNVVQSIWTRWLIQSLMYHIVPAWWMLMNVVQSIYHIACLMNVNECSTKYLPHCLPDEC